jgi:hypothetical protein
MNTSVKKKSAKDKCNQLVADPTGREIDQLTLNRRSYWREQRGMGIGSRKSGLRLPSTILRRHSKVE